MMTTIKHWPFNLITRLPFFSFPRKNGGRHNYWAILRLITSPLYYLILFIRWTRELNAWVRVWGDEGHRLLHPFPPHVRFVSLLHLWLVNGRLKYHRPIITNACAPKQSQKSLRRKLVHISLIVSRERYCGCRNSRLFLLYILQTRIEKVKWSLKTFCVVLS